MARHPRLPDIDRIFRRAIGCGLALLLTVPVLAVALLLGVISWLN